MPPRPRLEPPNPAVPAFNVPTSAPAGQVGPTFGGATEERNPSGAPLVGVGRPHTETWRRPAGARLAREYMGASESEWTQTFEQQPADRVLQSIFDMPKTELRALQLKMYDSGFYGNVKRDAVVFGAVDDATWGAFGDLLEMTASYNSAGQEMTWFEVLDEMQRLRKEQGTNLLAKQGPERDPFVARTTNPDDIRATAEAAAQEILGGVDVDPGLIDRIIARFNSREVGAQRAAYDAQPGGGVVQDAPSLQTFVADEVENADPTRAQAHSIADDYAGALRQFFQGSM